MTGVSFNPRQWLRDHGEVAESGKPPSNPPNPSNQPPNFAEPEPGLGGLGGLGGGQLPAATSHAHVEREIDVLARRVRVALWLSGETVTCVELLTRDDARRRLVEAIDARLRAGVGLAVQAVEQAAHADVLRELLRIELGSRRTAGG